ncbi:MAG: hypothetical protein N2255_01730 [Kiritimatiellae bacterium]|nr:hypothetical protein [Kiritimatiellia bacterium]
MEDKSNESFSASSQPKERKALFLELENIAAHGRQVMFEVLKKILDEKEIDLEPLTFSRYCLERKPSEFLPRLLEAGDKRRISKTALEEEFVRRFRSAVLGEAAHPPRNLIRLLAKLTEAGVCSVGALTTLERESALALLEKLELRPTSTLLEPYSGEFGYTSTTNPWFKLVTRWGGRPENGVVLATCAASCRAALAAGLHCVVITDAFTEYQDFAGADCVREEFDETVIDTVISLLRLRI